MKRSARKSGRKVEDVSKVITKTDNHEKKADKKAEADDDGEYEVEQVVDMEVNQKRKCPIKFRVRWVGYGEVDDSWILLNELSCDSLINDFLEVSGRKPEYEKALETTKRPDPLIRSKRTLAGRTHYGELAEDDEEILPSGTRSRNISSRKRKLSINKSSKHKPAAKKTKATKPISDDDDDESDEEYEVEAIVGRREIKGKIQYRVNWKGYAEKYDSWLFKDELSCNNLIKQYDEENETKEEEEEEQEWKVENVLKMRTTKSGKHEYLIHWKGYNSSSDTWEPEENVTGCSQLDDFIKNSKEKTNANATPVKKVGRARAGRPKRKSS